MPDHEGTAAVAAYPTELNDDGSAAAAPGGAGWGVDFLAKVGLQLGRLSDTTDAMTNELAQWRKRAALTPAMAKIVASFQFSTAAGASIVNQQGGLGIGVVIGGPDPGFQWSVRQIIVGGTTLTATPAGVAWFMVTAAPTAAAAGPPNIGDVVDFTHNALPQTAFYSEREFFVQPNESIVMVVTGGTNLTQYVASVAFMQTPYRPQSSTVDT